MTTPDPRPTQDKDAALVQQMFDRVAPRYDIANTIFSFGQDRHWRRVAAAAARVGPGDRVLDVATGTGALAAELAQRGAEVVALDFSWNMVATGAARLGSGPGGRVRWVNGDGTRLPLPDASVDAVTIAFGLRNLPDTDAGLAEFARVTRPGGRLVVLEFSTPAWTPFRTVYDRYLLGAIPTLAQLVTSDPAAYRYLAESIKAWPDQEALAAVISAAGWGQVSWCNLTGGIVTAHRATRP
jgi:demethylmenaquinone methyltransferase / 2-methoxy-6-polyprenyl-1,4-benzoquinol methylase